MNRVIPATNCVHVAYLPRIYRVFTTLIPIFHRTENECVTSTETGESCARRLSFAKPVRVIFCKRPLETGIFHRLTLTPTSLQANPNVSAATFFSLSDFTVRNPRVKLVRMTRQDPRRFAKVPCSEGNPFSAFLCVCESISLLSLRTSARALRNASENTRDESLRESERLSTSMVQCATSFELRTRALTLAVSNA